MRTHLCYGLALVLLVGVNGCGGGGPEGIIKDKNATTKEIAGILEGIKDDASADAAMPKLDKACEKLGDLNKKFFEINISMEEMGKLLQKNSAESTEASQKLKTATESAQKAAPGKTAQITAALAKSVAMPKLNLPAK